jgi:GTPase SAR1 family protein
VRVLHGNVLTCINTLITEANNFHYDFGEYSDRVDAIEAFDTRNLLSVEVVNAISDLWYHSEAIRKTWERRSEFWILEGCEYYFENMTRFVEEGYSPTEEDIVLARKRTTGVVETQLKYGGVDWSVVDVGGQRSERRKWMNSFEGVKGILFCVNLAGFCSVLFEDRSVNRMQESLKLFEETMSNPIFAETPVFLILNKKDLFERLIETKSLKIAFPEYDGPQELRPCIEYIAHKFASVLKPSRPKPMVLLMAARVKRDVKYCFEDIRETLLDANSKDVRKAKARLDELREKRKAEQLEEMEHKAAERRQAEEQRLKEAKENGTKPGHANGNGATKGSFKNGATR